MRVMRTSLNQAWMTRHMWDAFGRLGKITTDASTVYVRYLPRNHNPRVGKYMAESNVFRRAIKASGDLARSGDPQQALKVVMMHFQRHSRRTDVIGYVYSVVTL
jgi:hypothetical protein